MKLSPQEFGDGLAALGISAQNLAAVRQAESRSIATERLDGLKTRARKAFRDAALYLHPDVNGGSKIKTERFMWLRAVLDQFETVQLGKLGQVHGNGWMHFDGDAVFTGGFSAALKGLLKEALRPHVDHILAEFKADRAARFQLLVPAVTE